MRGSSAALTGKLSRPWTAALAWCRLSRRGASWRNPSTKNVPRVWLNNSSDSENEILMSASKAELLATKGRKYAQCQLLTLQVRLQSLTERERAAYERLSFDEDGVWQVDCIEGRRRELLVRCIVNDEGQRLFADNEADQLAELDGGDMDLLFDAARELCGFNRKIEVKKNPSPPAGNSP